MKRYLLLLFIPAVVLAQFGSGVNIRYIDQINNEVGTDITLNPVDKVKINYFTGEKALQSTIDGELEESTVTKTELGYVSGVTSSIQTQLDSKLSTLPLFANGDLLYYNGGYDRLAIGLEGQVLTVDAFGFPSWQDATGGTGGGTGGSRLNLVEFPSFENSEISEGTCSNCTQEEETSIVLATANNLSSLKITATSNVATYSVDKSTSTEWHDGLEIIKWVWIKTTAPNVKLISRKNGSNESIELNVSSDGKWHPYKIFTTSGETSNGYQVYLPLNGDIAYIDEVEIRPMLSSDQREISQTSYVGSLRWYSNAACNWSSSSSTFGEYADDADCDNIARDVDGLVDSDNGLKPNFTIPNAKAGYKYKVTYVGMFFKSGADNYSCNFRLNYDGNNSNIQSVSSVQASVSVPVLQWNGIEFHSDGNKEVQLHVSSSDNTSNCLVNLVARDLKITVEAFAKESVTAISQNIELAEVDALAGIQTLSGLTTVTFGTENLDNKNAFNGTTFTVPYTSKYLFNFGALTQNSTGTGGFSGSLYVNGSPATTCKERFFDIRNKMYSASSNRKVGDGETICNLNAGELVTFRVLDADNTDLFKANLQIQEIPLSRNLNGLFTVNNFDSTLRTKCQKKYLTADVTTNNADIADLRFTNLTIGKRYKIFGNINSIAGPNDVVVVIEFKNNGIEVLKSLGGNGSGTAAYFGGNYYGEFIATATSVLASTENFATGSSLNGDNTDNQTNVTLCQMPDLTDATTEW